MQNTKYTFVSESEMLNIQVEIGEVPEYLFQACGVASKDRREEIRACVQRYARDCVNATLLSVKGEAIIKDAWRYRTMVENGVVPSEWHIIISEGREGFRERADEAFDAFVAEELVA